MAAKSERKEWFEAMKKLPSLPDEVDHYREVFLAISPTVLQKDRVFNAVIGLFDTDVMEQLTDTPSKKERFNMLAVGLGEGKHEFHMLKKLSSHFTSIRLVAVDPNTEMLQTFCEKLNNCDVTKTVEYHPFSGTYAEFLDSSLADVNFNLITAIHSLYYLGDLTEVVPSMLSSLDHAGILYADIITDDNDIGKMFKHKPWLIDRTSFKITTSSVVQSIAEKNEYAAVTHRVPITYDFQSILDEASVYGNQILDFLTMTAHFRRDAPKDVVEDCLTFYRENLSSDHGELTGCGDDGLLIISKQ